ncbi:MAG: C4-dicarboxylate ABC transporter permease [Betaproteobacteria bacterium RIFCSPLOWO2_02_FULL_67_26]|nr:MAG: C4-dicarboxylate ABC transporter permease [Betaproteobacteria bacterium RIFCSPLOWO2_02_FULL_67_26]
MSPTTAGVVGMAALLVLLFLRMPIGIAMALVGAIGIAFLNSPDAALHILGSYPYSHGAVQALSVIPLFVLMGNFAVVSGMSGDLFAAAYAWMGHRRGGLASATVLACAGFAALSGSSVASAITMGRVTLPEMRKYSYDPRLATGVVAAGGSLGILIPPSTALVIYGILTEQSIGKLFLAGFLPGLLLTALFMITVVIVCAVRPDFGPPGPRAAVRERWAALRRAGAFFLVLVATIGGMYAGVFTVTEASGVGAGLTLAHAILRRKLTWAGLSDALLQTVRTTAMVFLILIGAHIFSPFLAMSRIPVDLANALTAMALPGLAVLAILLVAYIILGMFLEGFAILVLTVPIVLPIMLAMNFDPIWFGIFMVIVLEMGLISPPVGINVFVVKGIAEDVPMYQIFAGILPFWVAMIVCVALLIAFPQIALILPNTMIR